jgi:hypothetical protein
MRVAGSIAPSILIAGRNVPGVALAEHAGVARAI